MKIIENQVEKEMKAFEEHGKQLVKSKSKKKINIFKAKGNFLKTY